MMDPDVGTGNGPVDAAPVLSIPRRQMAAVEHPAMLTSLQRGIDSFAGRANYNQILLPQDPQTSVPVFLRYADPTSSMLSSHSAPTHNVVLAVHVPKRTGMKRKRGSDGPWEYDPSAASPSTESTSRQSPGDALAGRDARRLRQRLQETAGQYRTEVVGIVKYSHRYRGLSDFQQSVHDSEFVNKFTENILPGELSKLRNFSITPGIAAPPNVDLPPPPFFTSLTMPFPYFYAQNPFVREVVSSHDGAVRLVNSTAASPLAGYLLGFDEEPIPTGPPPALGPITGRRRVAILNAMRRAVEERPVWTRRGLINRMVATTGLPLTENRLKPYFGHVCYQFKGGPWRDTLVRYGVDPRTDPECRQYQTMQFKLHKHEERKDAHWHAVEEVAAEEESAEWVEAGARRGRHIATLLESADATAAGAGAGAPGSSSASMRHRKDTHIFDGRSYCDDGKIWQVCDLLDPVLAKLLGEAPVRPECERIGAGWYHQGTWAKARAIMKIKLVAIRFGRIVDDASFNDSLAVPNETPKIGALRSLNIPVPNLNLTPEETATLSSQTYHGKPERRRKRGLNSMSVPLFIAKRSGEAAKAAGEKGADGTRGNGEAQNGQQRQSGAAEEADAENVDDEENDGGDMDEDDEADEDADDNQDEVEEEDEEDEEEEEEDEEARAERIAIKEEILEDME